MDKVVLICSLIKEKKEFEARRILKSNFIRDSRLFNYYMGLSYLSESNFKKADYYFSAAEDYGLYNFLFFYNYGLTCLELKKTAKAKELFKTSIRLNKEHKESYLSLSYILESEGYLKEAYRVLKCCLCYLNDIELLKYEEKLLNKIINV